jgi:hypothetical protein
MQAIVYNIKTGSRSVTPRCCPPKPVFRPMALDAAGKSPKGSAIHLDGLDHGQQRQG